MLADHMTAETQAPRTEPMTLAQMGVRLQDYRKEERIRAHIILCWLALLLIRIIENQSGDTWRNLCNKLQRMHVGTFSGPAGTVLQRTETTAPQRAILTALQLKEPPRFLHLQAPTSRKTA
jgi:hypothetical protein